MKSSLASPLASSASPYSIDLAWFPCIRSSSNNAARCDASVRIHGADRSHEAPARIWGRIVEQTLDLLEVRRAGISHSRYAIAAAVGGRAHEREGEQADSKASGCHCLLSYRAVFC